MLSVRSGARAVELYKTALGAEELFSNENGVAVIAQLRVGETDFRVADESPVDLNFNPETLGGGSVRMILVVSDPHAAFDQAVAAGAKVVTRVRDERYGWRVGRVVYPFRHHWEIGKPLS